MEIYEEPEFTKEQKKRAEQLVELLDLSSEKRSKEKIIDVILTVMCME